VSARNDSPEPFCGATCGNGTVEAGEACDDGNLTNGDGCTAACTVQTGYSCTGTPSVCTEIGLFPLTVSRSGTGTGAVYSTPAGISCGGTCVANYFSKIPATPASTS
jgi:cysteine-rich repeat protein